MKKKFKRKKCTETIEENKNRWEKKQDKMTNYLSELLTVYVYQDNVLKKKKNLSWKHWQEKLRESNWLRGQSWGQKINWFILNLSKYCIKKTQNREKKLILKEKTPVKIYLYIIINKEKIYGKWIKVMK